MDEDFAGFVSSRYLPLVRRAFLLTGDHAAAEDLVQESLAGLLLAWRRGGVVDPDRYVARSLANAAVSRWRRRPRGELLTGVVPEQAGPDPSGRADDRDLLWRGLQALPGRQRAVLVLRYFEDLPDREIADLVGVGEASVRSLAARGLDRLRRGGALRAASREVPG